MRIGGIPIRKLHCMIHGHQQNHNAQSAYPGNSIILISALPVHGTLTRLKKVLI